MGSHLSVPHTQLKTTFIGVHFCFFLRHKKYRYVGSSQRTHFKKRPTYAYRVARHPLFVRLCHTLRYGTCIRGIEQGLSCLGSACGWVGDQLLLASSPSFLDWMVAPPVGNLIQVPFFFFFFFYVSEIRDILIFLWLYCLISPPLLFADSRLTASLTVNVSLAVTLSPGNSCL